MNAVVGAIENAVDDVNCDSFEDTIVDAIEGRHLEGR